MVTRKLVRPRRIHIKAPTLLRLCPSTAQVFMVHNSATKQMFDGFDDSASPGLIESGSNVGQRELCVVPRGKKVASLIWRQDRIGDDAYEMGAYVVPHLRRRGLALALWWEMFRLRKTRAMRLKVVSREGDALVKSLTSNFPNVVWNVEREEWLTRNTP